MATIPLQLVTGFLGSGKTTFLKNYLNEFSGSRKIGIIQNEFSEVNVDSRELHQQNAKFEILEVNNGSVFCVCLLGSFIDSLAAFINQVQPDELILEASGMSDPLSIGQILQAPQLKGKVYLDRVWCMIDAVNFLKINGLQTRVNHQIRIADTILINKTDLINSSDGKLLQIVKKLNPFAELILTSYAKIDFLQKKPMMKFIPPGEQAENGRPDLQSHIIKSNRLISPENLDKFLQVIIPESIRCKGYINMTSGVKVFIQGSFDQITLQEAAPFAAPTELVVIGNFQHQQLLQNIFDKYCTA